ncbi:MAG: acyl-ACP--UDP-N-acetylglucosamine O-acyltransferase [Brevinemataceae bacterium]
MPHISPQSIINGNIQIGNHVHISPFSIIEGDVVIGDNTYIHPFVHIKGPVEIGAHNQIFNNVTIGLPPQDTSYQGSSHKVIIGNHNVFREGVTIHAPVSYTDQTISPDTRIGNHCLLMVQSHVSHNTVLKDDVIFANGVLPAGCCFFDNGVFVSGGALIHQHVRVGSYSIISGGSRVGRDIPPFMLVSSFYGLISGINSIGLRRAGFSIEDRNIAKDIFRMFKHYNALNTARQAIFEKYGNSNSKLVQLTLEFLDQSKRGISEFSDGSQAKDMIF